MNTVVYQNVLVAVGTVVYTKLLVGVCDYCVARKLLASKISRKVIHLGAASWLLFWPYFHTDHWTWTLNVVVPAVYTVQLFVKGAILQNVHDPDVQTMTRTGNPSELLNGPMLFTIIMTMVGLTLYRHQLGIVIMACLGYGDGIAPLVGYYCPAKYNVQYPTYPFGPTDTKSIMGTLGFILASLVGYRCILQDLILDDPDHRAYYGSDEEEWTVILKIVTIVALTEGICGPYDNPCIALSATVAYYYYLPN